jgi:hypothetical protein
MASDPIQGLRVSNKFSDAQDTVEILKNLNLDIEDLNRIRNISPSGGGGVSRTDIRTISGLEIDLEKEAIGVYNETLSYQNVLSTLNDGRRSIAGNINASSSVISTSFKFNAINYASNNAIESVDFSTSRSSAWSSFTNPTTLEDYVYYGGDVILSGNTSAIELSSLEFTEVPKVKRFESQIPTHKIRVSIDDEPYDLYAMKNIPLQFKGFFRSVRDLRIDFNILSGLRPSWIIRNKSGQEFVYQNRTTSSGTTRQSIVSFFDSQSQDRTMEFYYPSDRIVRILLNSTRLSQIPNAILPSLIEFSAIDGDLVEMPDITTLYPSIRTLNLSRNDLTRSDDPVLRTFSPQVIARLQTPSNTLETLILDGVYSNNCTADLAELANLRTFQAVSAVTNNRRMTGTSPAVGNGIITYTVRGNNFTTLHSTVIQSTTLQNLDIRANAISTNIDTSGTNLENIVNFVSGGNFHPIVDMSNKTKLKVYRSDSQTFPTNSVGTGVFSGCTLLEEIYINNTNVSGALPNFGSNDSLRVFFSPATSWSDASPTHSIAANTFGSTESICRTTITDFNLQSGNLRGPIDPSAFLNMTALRNLVVRSFGRGITGEYPSSLNGCFNLRTLNLIQNKLTGQIPNFAGNSQIRSIVLSFNMFSGEVPVLDLPQLIALYINNNSLTKILGLICLNMTELNASFNLLEEIPNLGSTPKLQNLFLNNNPNMKYITGELIKVTSIRRIEMANCGLTAGNVDQALKDLNENYNINPRRNVFVNLSGNSAPSATAEITTIIDRLRREGWTLGLQT